MTLAAAAPATPDRSPAPAPAFSILCVDDEANILSALRRLFRPHGYTVHLSPPWGDYPTDDVQADAQRMNTHLEDWIRQRPEEYFWLHKRFKTRPPGMPPVY